MADLPPAVSVQIVRQSLHEYWLARAAQHTQDSYVGVPMSKFPEDLRVYEHLLWLSGADVVIELGVQHGASSLWFRDRLRSLASYRGGLAPRVIGVELDSTTAVDAISRADPDWRDTITILEADVRDPALPQRVAELVPDGARCLVVEDTAHEYDTTRAALEGFASFVAPGGFFVVEDGCVDVEELRLSPDWPRGVLPALEDWLATDAGSAFKVRRDLELYGISCHPSGFLQRAQ